MKMKKIFAVLISVAFALSLISCYDYTETHKMAGVWEITLIENYAFDSSTMDFKLMESYEDPGYFYMYDNDNISSLNVYNDLAWHISDSAVCFVTNSIDAAGGGSNLVFWYSDDKERLVTGVYNSSQYQDIYFVLSINDKSFGKQEWYFFPDIRTKEVIYVKRAKY